MPAGPLLVKDALRACARHLEEYYRITHHPYVLTPMVVGKDPGDLIVALASRYGLAELSEQAKKVGPPCSPCFCYLDFRIQKDEDDALSVGALLWRPDHTSSSGFACQCWEIRDDGSPMTMVEGDPHQIYAALIWSTWIVAAQRIVLRGPVHFPRAQGRQLDRIGPGPIPDAQVVTLRRSTTRPADTDPNSRPVDWSHRWIVGGHWRNQYISEAEGHRLTWVHEHVKGPEDKPLVADRYVALVR